MLINGVEYTPDKSGTGNYYGRYQYRCKVQFKCVNWVRYIPTVDYYDTWLTLIPFSSHFHKSGPSTQQSRVVLAGGDIGDLRQFIEWRGGLEKGKVKVVITEDNLMFYYNCHTVYEDFIRNFPHFNGKLVPSQRVVDRQYETGVIYHVNPKNKYRIYLKQGSIEFGKVAEFVAGLQKYNYHLSPKLSKRLYSNTKLQTPASRPNYFPNGLIIWQGTFVDTDDDSLVTIFALKWPELINKVCRIEQR